MRRGQDEVYIKTIVRHLFTQTRVTSQTVNLKQRPFLFKLVLSGR
jgi:hypothetical protein